MEINKISEEQQKNILSKVLEVLKTMASRHSGFIGLCILVFHILLAFLSPYLAPYDYKAIDPTLMLQAPSSEYLSSILIIFFVPSPEIFASDT